MSKPERHEEHRPRQRRLPGMNPQKKDQGHGIERDIRGQDQPADKARAQQKSGIDAQKEAATDQPQSPGEPAGGE